MTDEPLIAVFIDYENLALGVRDMKQGDLQLDLVVKRLLEKGRIVFKRAYCDWSQYRSATRSLHLQGVELVDIPRSRMSGKNSADIHMVVDALDLCYSKEHIDYFALLSGDSDFSPLVSKLKENDKWVLGCGVKSSTSDLLIASCDEFIYYDDLEKAARKRRPIRKKSKKSDTGADTEEEPGTEEESGVEPVVEIIRSLSRDYDPLWGSLVKQTLRRVHPGFNESSLGHKNFTAMLKSLASDAIIDLEHDSARGNYKITLKDD